MLMRFLIGKSGGDILRDVVLSERDNVRQLVEMVEMLGEGVKVSIYGADIGMIEGECSTAERNGLTVNSAEVWVNQVLWWGRWRWARRRRRRGRWWRRWRRGGRHTRLILGLRL